MRRRSPRPAARGQAPPERIAQAIRDPVRTIITPDLWKFSLSTLGEHELYDLRADPLERRNLAFEADQQARVGDLTRRVRLWQPSPR